MVVLPYLVNLASTVLRLTLSRNPTEILVVLTVSFILGPPIDCHLLGRRDLAMLNHADSCDWMLDLKLLQGVA